MILLYIYVYLLYNIIKHNYLLFETKCFLLKKYLKLKTM